MSLPSLLFVTPLLLVAAAIAGFGTRAVRSFRLARATEAAALFVFAVAALSAVATLLGYGSTAAEPGGLATLVRLDSVSLAMVCLVAFIGWIVVRYARTYLDGEAGYGAFLGWLCLALACVLWFVMAGHLILMAVAWIATGICLQRLLLFYPGRIGARRAARKKMIIGRVGDVALVGAFISLYVAYASFDVGTILAAARSGQGGGATIVAAGLLALSALLASAQFPVHGWLTEVMETPTPVSALLHAGIINAGGFLLIRFADVMILAPGVLAALAILGGLTALFGSLVMLTQSAVKTSLAWSTIAQMGFMIFECGLGLFPLALLHILAHSLYKAHAFLAAGEGIERVAAARRPGPVAIPKAAAVGRAFLLALGLYALTGLCFGFAHKSPQAIALGAILIFGVAYLLAQGLADAAPRQLTYRTSVYAVATSITYFGLQTIATRLTAGTLPPVPAAGPLEWTLIVIALISFGSVALLQVTIPLWSNHPAASGLRVHLANGFYANAFFDRLLANWSMPVISR